MKRLLILPLLAVLVLTACGTVATVKHGPPGRVSFSIPAAKPPSPTTWPAYPRFSQHSCWARPFEKGTLHEIERVAPSYAPAKLSRPIPPRQVAEKLLARFGDRRYVHSITFAPAKPAVGSNIHVLYAGGHPPTDALEATVHASEVEANFGHHPTPDQSVSAMTAQWEADIAGGALRDDMCAAGGAPIVSWSTSRVGGGGFSETYNALGMRFPNPSPAAFRRRAVLVGRRYGFRIVSLRLLQPEQLAPLLTVATNRSRSAFAKDVPAIEDLLNPRTTTGKQTAYTFEAFMFVAEDAKGPFLATESESRGESGGGEWAANRCIYPYPTLGPVLQSQKPCP